MKKIILILPLFLFLSCGPEAKMYHRTYSIQNESDKEVKIQFYQKFDGSLKEEIKLTPGSIFKGVEMETDQRLNNDPDSFHPSYSFYSSDSLVFIFNNEKIKTDVVYDLEEGVIFSDPIERNTLRHGNYESTGGNNFIFEITQQDYENALLCEDNCR